MLSGSPPNRSDTQSRKLLARDAVGKSDEFLLAFGSGADNYEQTLRVVLEPGLDVDAIGPGVSVPLGRQVARAYG